MKQVTPNSHRIGRPNAISPAASAGAIEMKQTDGKIRILEANDANAIERILRNVSPS